MGHVEIFYIRGRYVLVCAAFVGDICLNTCVAFGRLFVFVVFERVAGVRLLRRGRWKLPRCHLNLRNIFSGSTKCNKKNGKSRIEARFHTLYRSTTKRTHSGPINLENPSTRLAKKGKHRRHVHHRRHRKNPDVPAGKF